MREKSNILGLRHYWNKDFTVRITQVATSHDLDVKALTLPIKEVQICQVSRQPKYFQSRGSTLLQEAPKPSEVRELPSRRPGNHKIIADNVL